MIKEEDVRVLDVLKKEELDNNIDKQNIVSELCIAYNNDHRKRTLICLSLFASDNKLILISKNLCG